VLAVDLSLSSLAYASRMAREKGVTNIRFVHGDILGLDALPDRFDMISSTGVLHHMRDPQAGLRVLARLLRPGGVMKLGLYSARARGPINVAREMIGKLQLAASEPEIRKFRQQVLDAGETSALRDLRTYHDFYSMSTCRDLLFHVQEHQLQLPQIDTMLQDMSLKLLGLANLPGNTISAYRRMFPGDPLMTDLANWDVFEAQYPATFTGMYKLWCAKTPE
jgi:SAM-dependent methyltransferase